MYYNLALNMLIKAVKRHRVATASAIPAIRCKCIFYLISSFFSTQYKVFLSGEHKIWIIRTTVLLYFEALTEAFGISACKRG